MHTDVPTREDLDQLISVRDAACVSIYLPTAPEECGVRDRLEFKSLGAEALAQLTAASIERDSMNELRDVPTGPRRRPGRGDSALPRVGPSVRTVRPGVVLLQRREVA